MADDNHCNRSRAHTQRSSQRPQTARNPLNTHPVDWNAQSIKGGSLDTQGFERVNAFPGYYPSNHIQNPYERFLSESGNSNFQTSLWTYFVLGFLILIYPVLSLIDVGNDPLAMLRGLSEGMLIMMLVLTIAFQWFIYLFNYIAVHQERTGLAGVGLTQIRAVDLAYGIAFLLAANLILSGLAWLLAQIGYPMSGELGLLIPKDTAGRIVWAGVAFTAGFCEEVAFRGYLMTRLRIMGRFNNWLIPTIVSAVAFGMCHAYQGIPGLIVITVYGVMFSLLYIRTGSLWPCIIAHFLQDLGALFFPQ